MNKRITYAEAEDRMWRALEGGESALGKEIRLACEAQELAGPINLAVDSNGKAMPSGSVRRGTRGTKPSGSKL